MSPREITKCKECGTPIAQRLDSRRFRMIKNHKGQRVGFTISYSGNQCSICCEKCGRDVTFMTNKIQLGMSYVIASPKRAVVV